MRRALALLGLLVVCGPPVHPKATAERAPRTWRLERDVDGRVERFRAPGGRWARFAFDAPGRLISVEYADGAVTAYGYDADGRLDSMTDGSGTTTYHYDAFDQLAAIEAPNLPRTDYERDVRGRLLRVALPDGWQLEYAYDLMDRLTEVRSPVGAVSYTYYTDSRVAGVSHPQTVRRLPNGVITTWTYDADMSLVGLRHDGPEGLLAGWSYAVDALGRIASIRDAVTGIEATYAYDDLNQLVGVFEGGQPTERFEYDDESNRRSSRGRSDQHTFTHDGFNQLTAVDDKDVVHDAGGLLRHDDSTSPARHFEFDGAGRLVRARAGDREVEYRYDGNGKLVERREGEDHSQRLYAEIAGVPQLLAEYRDGNADAHYLLAPQNLGVRHGMGEVQFFLEDHLGSVRVVTDAGGRVVSRSRFSAFGAPAGPEGSKIRFGFTGAWHDPTTGLVHLGARWYEPRWGRFISPDAWLGAIASLPTLNRYVYAANDPVNWFDPSGTQPQPKGPDPLPPLPLWDLERRLEIGRDLIDQRIQQNFQLMGRHPSDPFRVVKGWSANFGWQFLAEMWSFGLGSTLQVQKMGTTWGEHLSDPSRVTTADALWETGLVAWDFGTMAAPALKSLSSTRLTTAALSRTGLLESAIARGTTGQLNRAAVRGIKTFKGAVKATDAYKTLGGLRDEAARSLDAYDAMHHRTNPPDAGGVWLAALAEGLDGFGNIDGISLDPVSDRLFLLGRRRRGVDVSIRPGDLAVAFHAVMDGQWPGVSIDPPEDDPRSDVHHYRYIGPTEFTHFGDVMAYADRWMKVIGIGEDNENPGTFVRPEIAGFRDQFDLGFRRNWVGETWNRFWLVPGEIRWEISPDGRTILCKRASIRVRTQVMEVRNGRLTDAHGSRDRAAEDFADWFTEHYDDLAVEYPVYEELRQLAKLVSLVEWLATELPRHQFEALAESLHAEFVETDKTTPALHRSRAKDGQQITIFGGVDLRPPMRPSRLPRSRVAEAIGEKLAVLGGRDTGFVATGHSSYQAVPLPLPRGNAIGFARLSPGVGRSSSRGLEWKTQRRVGGRGYSRSLRRDGEEVYRESYDHSNRRYTRTFSKDRVEEVTVSESGRPLRGTVTSATDGTQVDVRFDSAGRLVSIEDPAGGVHQWHRANDLLESITVPSGSYRFRRPEKGVLEVTTPAGRMLRLEGPNERELTAVSYRSEAGTSEWRRGSREADNWELRHAGRVQIELASDGRGTVSVSSGGRRAFHQLGEGGSVIRTPTGRQITTRRSSRGNLEEVREYPPGSNPQETPSRDLTGSRRTDEKASEFEEGMKREG